MNLRLKLILVSLLWFGVTKMYAQSDNCVTATPLTLVNGQLCVTGTSTNATSNNTMYGTCNANPVNEVWYTYVASGGQNDFTITSNGLTDAEIVIDIDGCSNTNFVNCAVATGTTTLTTSWGIIPGTQVWIAIASNGGVDGDFTFCINSSDPPPGGGNGCTGAIPLCDKTLTHNFPDMSILTSSGVNSTCFPGAGNQDLWYQFTVTQSGILEWEATPTGNNIELDWTLWDITNGCPGAEVACNYNFTGGGLFGTPISSPIGMIGTTSCVACPTSGINNSICAEYCDPVAVTAGNTYAILIDNFTNTQTTGINFTFGPGMTAEIGNNADFTINPSGITCGTNVTVNIADASLGIPDWTFGNGNTFTGNNPPAQTYTVPGVYAITATFGGACPSTHTEYVEIYGPLTATSSSTNVSCSSCNGTASISAAGGDGIFSYLWSNAGETTPSISGLCQGSYTVTITNATCSTQVIETVVVGTGGLFPFTTASTDAACAGDSSGTATFIAQSGNPPYTYVWSNGQTNSTATGLPAGSYNVSVTDAFGCDTITTINVNDPALLVIDASNVVITNAGCIGADGSIAGITSSGGLPALTFTWLDASTTVVGNTQDLSNIAPGSYTLIVNDVNGCIETSGPYLIAATSATSVVTTGTLSSCFQSCDGTGTVAAGGGVPPYFYTWSTNPAQTSASVTGLCQGTYFVTVNDASCSPSGVELVSNGDFSGGNTGFSSVYFFCNSGGCLGPAGGYGVGTSANFYNGGFSGSDHTTGSGNFMILNGSTTAGDNVWCQTIAVTPNTSYQFSTWLSSLNTSNVAILQCTINGNPLGTSLNAPGSVGTWVQFFETWNSGVNTSATICITNQNTAGGGNDFGLDDISFQECVNACPAIDSVVISEPAALTVSLTKTDVLCFAACDGSAMATTSNGTGPYTYAWSSSGTSSAEFGLCMGTYTVTVTDFNGCDTTMAIFINEPSSLLIGGGVEPEKCGKADGKATATIFGGTPGYAYLWDDPNAQTTATATGLGAQIYTVIVTDTNGCTATLPFPVSTIAGPEIDTIQATDLACTGDADATASVVASITSPPFTYIWDDPSAQTGLAASNLGAGTYSITVSDIFGCDTIASITIVDPLPISISVSGTDTLCFGQTNGELNSVTTGGQGPYTYLWDDPLISTTDTVNLAPLATTTYTVIVVDSAGCSDTNSMEIFLGAPLVASTANVPICEGEIITITVNPSGGNGPPYSYAWSTNPTETTQSISVNPDVDSTYTVIVTDACSSPTTEAVEVTVSPKPNAAFDIACDPNPFLLKFSDSSKIANGGIIDTWAWDFEDGFTSTVQHPVHDYSASSTYMVSLTVTTIDGCTDQFDSIIQSAPIASFIANPEETTTANPTIEFTDGSSADVLIWNWAYGDDATDSSFSPVFSSGDMISHTYDSAGIYGIVLTVANAQGCIDTTLEYIQIIEEYIIFIPNVFSPNNNQINDVFRPVGVGINPDKFEMLIFDRWGDLIYETTDYELGWDGRANGGQREAQSDVYIWVVNTVDPALGKHQYVGHVTLIK